MLPAFLMESLRLAPELTTAGWRQAIGPGGRLLPTKIGPAIKELEAWQRKTARLHYASANAQNQGAWQQFYRDHIMPGAAILMRLAETARDDGPRFRKIPRYGGRVTRAARVVAREAWRTAFRLTSGFVKEDD